MLELSERDIEEAVFNKAKKNALILKNKIKNIFRRCPLKLL